MAIKSETRLKAAVSSEESGGGAGFRADVGIGVGWEMACGKLEEICIGVGW